MGSIGDVLKTAVGGSLNTIDAVLAAAGSVDMGSFADTGAELLGSLSAGSDE